MGYGMAMNIRKKIPSNSVLYINDLNSAACNKFVTEFGSFGHVKIVDSAREVAANALTIISIVPAAMHVKQVYLDSQSGVIAAKANPDRLILECSTIDAETAKEVGKTLENAGSGTYIDTPVSVSISLLLLERITNPFTEPLGGSARCGCRNTRLSSW
jgi:3-hydroxyisobutyrate dehydrogenase